MFEQFFDPEMLATFAGCVLATGIITQMFKKIGFLVKINTQLISYVVAFLVLLGATLTLGTFTFSALFLMLLNAAIVSLASNGGFDLVDTVHSIGEKNEKKVMAEKALAETVDVPVEGVIVQ